MDNLANTVFVFFELAFALCIPHFLHDDLFGGLGCDPSKINGWQLVFDQVTDARCRVPALRICDCDFCCIIVDDVHNVEQSYETDFAGIWIDAGADFIFRSVARLGRFLDRFGHCFKNQFAFDRLFPRDCISNLQKFQSIRAHSLSHCLVSILSLGTLRSHMKGIRYVSFT